MENIEIIARLLSYSIEPFKVYFKNQEIDLTKMRLF